MIIKALNRTWQQLLHPKFRSVFLKSFTATLTTLILLSLGLYHYWPETFVTGWDWLDGFGESIASAGFWTVVFLGSYLLFPGIVTMVMGIFADEIADAVEDEYYPNRKGTRKVGITDVIISAAKLTLVVVLLNLLAFPLYILLFFMSAGIGTLALYIALNGFLIGREYFEMVAIRHMDRKTVTLARQRYSNKIFMGGALIAAIFMVPFLNLLAPIIGAAMMTHIFHHLGSGK